MIVRILYGWTKPEDANTYEELLRDEIFPSIAVRTRQAYPGLLSFVRDDGDGGGGRYLILRSE